MSARACGKKKSRDGKNVWRRWESVIERSRRMKVRVGFCWVREAMRAGVEGWIEVSRASYKLRMRDFDDDGTF